MQNKFELIDLYFESFDFKRTEANYGNVLNVKYEPVISVVSKENIIAKVTMSLQDKDNVFELNVTVLAKFRVNLGTSNENEIKELVSAQISQAIYPVLRAQISILTAMPGFSTIVLPVTAPTTIPDNTLIQKD